MIKGFEFVDGGVTFTCMVEEPTRAGMPPWWFFQIDTRATTRYAPFAAANGDTKESVKARILTFYAAMLATEARPAYQRPTWRKPGTAPAVSAEAAAPAAT